MNKLSVKWIFTALAFLLSSVTLAAGDGSLEMQLQKKAAGPVLQEAYSNALQYLGRAKEYLAEGNGLAKTGKFTTKNKKFVVSNYGKGNRIGAFTKILKSNQNPAVTQDSIIFVYANASGSYNKTSFKCLTDVDKNLQETRKARSGSVSVLFDSCVYNPNLKRMIR